MDITGFARVGIQQEIERLQRILEGLPKARGAEAGEGVEVAPEGRRRGRRPMTAAQRAAHSKRMKAIWAAKRKGQ